MVKIPTENRSYQRDLHSKALIMTDRGKADDYLSRKRMMDRARAQESELNTLKSELTELRELVGKLLDASK